MCDTGVLVIRLGDVVVMMRVGDEFIWKSAFFFHHLVSASLQRFTFEVSFRVHSRLELLQWIVPERERMQLASPRTPVGKKDQDANLTRRTRNTPNAADGPQELSALPDARKRAQPPARCLLLFVRG